MLADPSPNLERVISRALADTLPAEAGNWAATAMATADSILSSSVITSDDARLLAQLHAEAMRWLSVPDVYA
jgi:hypothetical protein